MARYWKFLGAVLVVAVLAGVSPSRNAALPTPPTLRPLASKEYVLFGLL